MSCQALESPLSNRSVLPIGDRGLLGPYFIREILSPHPDKEIWPLNRRLMAYHLSAGKSRRLIKLASPAAASTRNAKLARRAEIGQK